MKNLKKVLALVLAFACAFTMFAGAAFTDQADISDVNADAVELLTTLNIIQGDPDGSFAPEREVTRAEMAKMIYTIRNDGNDDASAYETITTSFTDISGHWAEGYIKYLQNTGIVAGKSAYIFDPDSTVTTGEAMKMALVLAGYRADKAELTGTNWLKNTVSLATTVGMTRSVQSAVAGGCTRQDAAQILSNTLTDVWAVQWSDVTNSFLNDSEQGLAWGGRPITVGRKWMDLTIYVGQLVSSGSMNVSGNAVAAAGKDRFTMIVDTVNDVEWNQWHWNNNVNWNPQNRALTLKDGKDHTDLVGQEVKVLTGDKIDEVYGVYATGTSKVIETTMSEITWDREGLKIDGTVYDCDNGNPANTAVYVDNSANALTVNAALTVNNTDVQKVADRVKLIDWDNNGDYDTIIVKTAYVAKVVAVNSNSITLGPVGNSANAWRVLNNNSTLDFDDDTIYEGVAKNDYTIVTRDLYTDDWIADKAEVVSGTVNGKVDNVRRVRLDGTWYTLANTNDDGDNDNMLDLCTINDSRETFENGDKVTLVVVDGIVYYAQSTSGNDANRSVLMVYNTKRQVGLWNDTNQAKVILADGTKKTVDVDKINGADPVGGITITNLTVGKMYYYTVNNDGAYSFISLAEDGEKAGYEHVNDNFGGIVSNRVDGTAIADDAVVFALVGGDDASVYTGKTVKDADVADGWGENPVAGQYLTETENGFNYARMLNVSIDDDETLNTVTGYGYLVTDAVRTKIDGVNYMEYEFWDGENLINAREKTDNDRRAAAKTGHVISFAYTNGTVSRADGDNSFVEIKDVVVDDGLVYAAMTGANSKSVQLLSAKHGTVTADITSDTLILYVDSNASTPEQVGQTGKEGFDYIVGKIGNTNRYPANVAYMLENNENEVKLLVIDVEGELDGQDPIVEGTTGVLNLTGSEADLINRIEAATVGTVNITGPATIEAGDTLTVPAGVEVTFKDALTLNGTIKGSVTAKTLGDSAGKIDGTLTITDDVTADNLDDLTGGKIVLKKEYTSTANFYQGTTSAAVKLTTAPAGTYTYTQSITPVTGGTAVNGWLKAAALSGKHTIAGEAAMDSKLLALLNTYDEVEVTGTALTFTTGLEIPTGKTLTIAATQTTAAELEKITGADSTSKLVLSAAQTPSAANKWFFGENGKATSFPTSANAALVGTYTYSTSADKATGGNAGWILDVPETRLSKMDLVGDDLTTAVLTNAYMYTDKVVAMTSAISNVVTVPSGKTLSIAHAPTGGITGEGTTEVTAKISLANVASAKIDIASTVTTLTAAELQAVRSNGLVKTIVLGAATTDNYSSSATKFFKAAGFEYNNSAEAIGAGTYVFTEDAGGTDVDGFVLK